MLQSRIYSLAEEEIENEKSDSRIKHTKTVVVSAAKKTGIHSCI